MVKQKTGVKANTLFTADNLYILNGMNSESVDLIYLDPPFNSKRMYEAPVGSKAAGSAFKDMWTWSDVQFLCFCIKKNNIVFFRKIICRCFLFFITPHNLISKIIFTKNPI